MHGSHIFPESKFHRLSVEPTNIMCQCFKHHSLWHEHPKGQDWFDEKFPGRKEYLASAAACFEKAITKPDYQGICEDLKTQYGSMIN